MGERMRLYPKVHLRDNNAILVDSWKKYFKDTTVEISQGDIFEHKAQAIVSPANSFGFMSGGIDLAYRDKFGLSVEKLVQKNIDMHYYGELAVGQALSVPMRGQDYKHLIVAPTMRIPMNVDNTMNAYLAFRAALLRAKAIDVESIICPGIATGAGKMCVDMAARQMFIAYKHVVLDTQPTAFDDIVAETAWMLSCDSTPKK
jgi:O-acetyl-ADP-ribose deacetylase (regulator of RNase III)